MSKNQIAPDGVLVFMRGNGIELTLDNYIALAYWHPHKMGIEEVMELPKRFQREALKRL